MRRAFTILLILGMAVKIAAQAGETPVLIGDVKSFKKTAEGISLVMTNARAEITAYSPTVIRVRVSQTPFDADLSYSVISPPAAALKEITDQKDKIVLKTDSLVIEINKQPYRIKFLRPGGVVLSEDYQPMGTTWLGTEVTTYRKLFPDEKFLGLGEKNGNMNRRGSAYTNWNTDIPSYSDREDPLYQSIPFFMGVHDRVVYGIFLDNSYRSRFNFGASTDDQFSSFSASNGEMNYYFFGSSSLAGIIRDYTSLTGRMPLPPYWSLGYQQSRWGYYPESEVMNIARQFRDRKIPCDVIYLDIDYMDGYKIFTWDGNRFPDPKKTIGTLNQMGFHVATIVDPGIKIEKGYFAYEEGIKNNYFLTYPDGSFYTGSVWPGRCHFPDFTNEATRTWWGSSFRHLVDPGVEGFWNDMNEPSAWGQDIPNVVKFKFEGHGATMAKGHNIYGLEMSRATYEGTKKLLNGKRPFLLTRAGFSGIQRYSAVWTGDNTATDNDILMAVRLTNSMGLSGIAFAGPDIGGFVNTPTKELFTRWLSIGVYTPFFRNHSARGTQDQEPWAFGEDVEMDVREMINQRYRLLPYIYSVFYESSLNGMPVARSLHINYTFEEKAWWWIYQHEYLFGPSILVAPLTSDQKFCKVWLPEGNWYRLSSGTEYQGPAEVIVDAPLNDLPVFVKEGAIIPMQSVIQNTSEKPDPVLSIHIVRSDKTSKFLYYEDDGLTFEYEKGVYSRRWITLDPQEKKVIFSQTEGTFNSKYTAYKIVFHGFGDGVKDVEVTNKKEKFEVGYGR